jgi:hypothetical protein
MRKMKIKIHWDKIDSPEIKMVITLIVLTTPYASIHEKPSILAIKRPPPYFQQLIDELPFVETVCEKS